VSFRSSLVSNQGSRGSAADFNPEGETHHHDECHASVDRINPVLNQTQKHRI
jgi:hypothetical protein